MPITRFFTAILLLSIPQLASAGLYFSGETQAELPARWRGFLLDLRTLRMIAVPPSDKVPVSVFREQYLEAATKLETAAKDRKLTAQETADLGALRIRLGTPEKALEILRAGQRSFPKDFAIAANLGTAWQLTGDLREAANALQDAVRLAPADRKPLEEFHLKLVRGRLKESKNATALDDLFSILFLDEKGEIVASKIADAARKKLPLDDIALVQQLLLTLPSDGRLLWQLGELANAHGDVRTAASILDGCVSEFGLAGDDLKKRRQVYREASDAISKLPDSEHEKYKGDFVAKSSRPLLRKLDASRLPAIRNDAVNALPWLVVGETVMGKKFQPKFFSYLEDLEGKQISITGFMQPLGDDNEFDRFMLLEFPIGCWFCESPETIGIIRVQLANGKSTKLNRNSVKVQGKLKLNRNDPEDFLYVIEDANVSEPD